MKLFVLGLLMVTVVFAISVSCASTYNTRSLKLDIESILNELKNDKYKERSDKALYSVNKLSKKIDDDFNDHSNDDKFDKSKVESKANHVNDETLPKSDLKEASYKGSDQWNSKTPDSETNSNLNDETSQLVEDKIVVRMPEAKIAQDDTYLCYAVKIPGNNTKPLYITQYEPHANQNVAHHVLLYACREPGTKKASIWDCGGMNAKSTSRQNSFLQAPICSSGTTILWAWARGASTLVLPKNVGFEIGPKTGLNYIVINAHFKSKLTANGNHSIHNTGVTLKVTTKPQPRLAGIYVSGTSWGIVPPLTRRNFDIVCRYNHVTSIHPFAFRVHTHALGVRVFGYKVSKTSKGSVWREIGERNPQDPEAFYPVQTKNLTISNGDWLASRCEMYNFRHRTTTIGAKHTDEMCNFYIMYWTHRNNNGHTAKTMACNNGYPGVHWRNYFQTLPF